MNSRAFHRAPWGTSLQLITAFTSVVLIGIAVIGVQYDPGGGWVWPINMIALPLVILLGASLFMIRGYEIAGERLWVQRLAWRTELSLDGLQSVEIDPEAMKRSVRTFGNGGLFCFAGRFRNKRLGSYRALATDPHRAVVLRYSDKTVVVTPGHPDRFKIDIDSRGSKMRRETVRNA